MRHRFAGCAGQLQHRIHRLLHGWSRRHRGLRVWVLLHAVRPEGGKCQGRRTAGLAVQLPDARVLRRKPRLPVFRHAFTVVEWAYVYTHDNNLQRGIGYHNVTQLMPAGITTGTGCPYGTFRGGITRRGKLLSIPGFRRRQLPGERRVPARITACKPPCSNKLRTA